MRVPVRQRLCLSAPFSQEVPRRPPPAAAIACCCCCRCRCLCSALLCSALPCPACSASASASCPSLLPQLCSYHRCDPLLLHPARSLPTNAYHHHHPPSRAIPGNTASATTTLIDRFESSALILADQHSKPRACAAATRRPLARHSTRAQSLPLQRLHSPTATPSPRPPLLLCDGGNQSTKNKNNPPATDDQKKRPPPHHTSTHPGLSLPAPKHHHEAGAVIRSTQIDQLHRALSSEHFAARRHDDIDAPHTQHRCALGTPTLSLPGHATIAGIVVSGDPEASSGLASDQGSTHS